MSAMSKPFTVNARLETRALNVSGDLEVFAASGKGIHSGWDNIREGLIALGFRLVSDGSIDSTAATEPSEPPVDGDSIYVHVSDATRADLIRALNAMPDEAFGWFVAWASGAMTQYPDGLGGFKEESRESILCLRKAAATYAP